LDRTGNVANEGHRLAGGERSAPRQAPRQRLAFHELHRQIELALGGTAEVGDLDDAGVADLARGQRLALETLHDVRAGAMRGAEHLQRDRPHSARTTARCHAQLPALVRQDRRVDQRSRLEVHVQRRA
jgi:hypothetical protein